MVADQTVQVLTAEHDPVFNVTREGVRAPRRKEGTRIKLVHRKIHWPQNLLSGAFRSGLG